jgi:hypothetical protein
LFFGIISSPPIITDSMPKSKFHHPDVFPEGGTLIHSTAYYSGHVARHFFQVVYLENQVKITARPGFQDHTHMLTHRFWG